MNHIHPCTKDHARTFSLRALFNTNSFWASFQTNSMAKSHTPMYKTQCMYLFSLCSFEHLFFLFPFCYISFNCVIWYTWFTYISNLFSPAVCTHFCLTSMYVYRPFHNFVFNSYLIYLCIIQTLLHNAYETGNVGKSVTWQTIMEIQKQYTLDINGGFQQMVTHIVERTNDFGVLMKEPITNTCNARNVRAHFYLNSSFLTTQPKTKRCTCIVII